MLERSHWWLAAAVILIGTIVPFAVSETFRMEPDAGFIFFVWCALAAALVAAGYGIWVAINAFARHQEGANADDPEHPGRASAALLGSFTGGRPASS